MSKKLTMILLGIIVVLSILLRFVKLGSFPPAITWDEAAVGYNAYTIWNWGKDEWGKSFPLTFKSFGDDKNPVHIYATVPFVGIFGLNEYATRAPAALFGVLNVVVIFFLARLLFKSNLVGLLAALFLAVSPFNIQFSRFSHELNFSIFFWMAGLMCFYKGLKDKKWYLLVAFLFFGIDLLTYHSAKIVTPFLLLLLIVLNLKKLLTMKNYFLWAGVIYTFFICLLSLNPELLGGARLQQNKIQEWELESTSLYQKNQNVLLATGEIVLKRYCEYFKPQFLFISGDPIKRHSIQTMGTFYWLDLPLLIVGFIALLVRLIRKKDWQLLLLLAWSIVAPLPGAASSIFPHAARAMFLTGSLTMVSAYGAYTIITSLKNKTFQIGIGSFIVIGSGVFVYQYLHEYFGNYANKYAIEWRYGMKQAVEVSQEYEYDEVYMTSAFMQPYIFFLYYLKIPLPEFLDTVSYNQTESRPSSLVAYFGKYRFIWDEYHSEPKWWVLYVVNPAIYDGLYQKTSFDVVKLIKYPNQIDALFAITVNGIINGN
ncbi:MAG: glycosyltransferase family 39 protein [Patescibacteria group bacterium]